MKKKLKLYKQTLKNLGTAGTFLPPTGACPGTFEAPTAGPTTICSVNCL